MKEDLIRKKMLQRSNLLSLIKAKPTKRTKIREEVKKRMNENVELLRDFFDLEKIDRKVMRADNEYARWMMSYEKPEETLEDFFDLERTDRKFARKLIK